ncbi:zinc finger protein ZFPM1 isoform X3 [Gopherus flavomarginatus]|uniref:zinc finger protein ZFPM1 isoform X3 n=1 Tax=Gopherus flavomarginatus TaxID=286002 RepID=UPI0021CBFBAB|nr:zinc finger protein ZFPM1 isoform X3 [Gopherus flavomarginatus]
MRAGCLPATLPRCHRPAAVRAAGGGTGRADCRAMSRRKQSNPRQIKQAESKEASESPKESKNEEPGENPQEPNPWTGPDELELVAVEGESRVRARRSLPEGLSWGPYPGNIHSEPVSPGQSETSPPVTLMLGDERCWLSRLPLVSGEADANSVIYRKGELIWCKTTQAIVEKELLSAFVMAEPQGIPNHTVKSEPGDSTYPAMLHADIQLLPQQAGMAAILATAVVNKDVFPCKDCGIWYRSERNLQAHLMYYCASRQSSSSPAVDEKPKETYPNERVCPFPQCKKSCPSASSLEIHMRSHSGERPFVCLICLSAFTTKANCERHLKVHTDTLNGVCHSCGFISTTRDILYSHLVTNHMICQPGSKGEVYSPGPGLPAAKPLAPGPSQPSGTPILKCSLCGSVADSLASLRQHVVLHGPLPAVFGGAEPTSALAQPESPANTPAVKPSLEDEVENGEARPRHAEGCPLASSSSSEVAPPLRIKEEPTDSPGGEGEVAKGISPAEPAASPRSEPEASSRASSPRSLHSVKVKSEIASPTPGSSPVPSEPGVGTASGTVFLPQYMFGHEATVMPQASEILAKMSELVHSRLKQGHGTVPPALYPSTPVPKGATCFECEITFNNINNYYVHKRLYCSSRHLAEDSPSSARKARAPPTTPKGPATPGALLSPQPPAAVEGQGPPSQEGEAERDASPAAPAAEAKPEIKVEEGGAGAKAGSPEADGAGRVSEDSQSPSSSVDDADDDPSKTVCEACNICFSRHETYMVHKRFYCASRHDPPLRRPSAPKVPFLHQPVRTRKRRKLYEIHGAASPALGPAHHLVEQLAGGLAGAADPLAGGTQPEVPPMLSALISVAKVHSAAPSPSSSPDADGPIDLSKKPRLQGEVLPTSLPPLADYHECTACRISFNSLDSYLAHKKYYCPAVPLQAGTLQQLHQIKGPVPPPLKGRGSGAPESPDIPGEETDRVRVKVEKAVLSASPGALVAKPMALPATYPCASGVDSLQRYTSPKALPLMGAKVPLAGCPYCPLNGAVKGDLIEHFRNAHGLLGAKPGVGPGLPEAVLQAAARTPAGCAPESSLPPLPAASPPQPLARLRKDSFNGKELTASSASNGSPLPAGSPRPSLPISPATPLNVSPVPEALREPGLTSGYTDKSVQTAPSKALPSPVPNGNHRYCRLCNIKFSSLSTFIAHKKYYCSSHAAEHVK